MKVALALLAALVCACQLPQRPSPDRTELLASPERPGMPVDVAVAPVINASGKPDVPLQVVREALYAGLPERLYSALRLEFVDRNWVDASTGRSLESMGADGVLRVEITGWDTAQLDTHRAVTATAQIALLDARGAASDPLWAAVVTRRVRIDRGRAAPLGERMAEAGEALARELLALLPERTADA